MRTTTPPGFTIRGRAFKNFLGSGSRHIKFAARTASTGAKFDAKLQASPTLNSTCDASASVGMCASLISCMHMQYHVTGCKFTTTYFEHYRVCSAATFPWHLYTLQCTVTCSSCLRKPSCVVISCCGICLLSVARICCHSLNNSLWQHRTAPTLTVCIYG